MISDDFKDLTIRPAHYSLQAGSSRGNDYGLNDWVIGGSSDGKSWAEFHRREHNSELDAKNAVKLFQVSRSDEVRMIRLLQLRTRGTSKRLALRVRGLWVADDTSWFSGGGASGFT
jgi:hypothetical protein